MNVRRLLLCMLCLGLVAGCSKPITADPTPDTAKPPTKTQPETPSPGANQGQPVAYTVKNSGIRCIAPPCPSYVAISLNDPKAEPIQIHSVDFQDVPVPQPQREEYMSKADTSPEGIKVEAVLLKQQNAGPAGDATVLRVKKVLE